MRVQVDKIISRIKVFQGKVLTWQLVDKILTLIWQLIGLKEGDIQFISERCHCQDHRFQFWISQELWEQEASMATTHIELTNKILSPNSYKEASKRILIHFNKHIRVTCRCSWTKIQVLDNFERCNKIKWQIVSKYGHTPWWRAHISRAQRRRGLVRSSRGKTCTIALANSTNTTTLFEWLIQTN